MENKIVGKVAKILNTRELVINIGTLAGVKIDMLFDVMDSTGENITDPDTGEILDSILRPKVRIKVIEVREKISIASTYKTKTVNVGGNGPSYLDTMSILGKSLMPPKYIQKYETFRTNEKTWEDISEEDSYVKTGDYVHQVNDEECD